MYVFINKPLKVTASLSESLRIRSATFAAISKTKKAVFNTLITTYGTDKSEYISSDIHSEVDMKCLFGQERL